MKTERVQYLMSPYNLREARRAREFRNAVIGIVGTIVACLIVGAVLFFRG